MILRTLPILIWLVFLSGTRQTSTQLFGYHDSFNTIDKEISSILPILLSDVIETGTKVDAINGNGRGVASEPLSPDQLTKVHSQLELVVSQTSARESLELTDVYELTTSASARLRTALSRALGTDAPTKDVMGLLKELLDGVTALLDPQSFTTVAATATSAIATTNTRRSGGGGTHVSVSTGLARATASKAARAAAGAAAVAAATETPAAAAAAGASGSSGAGPESAAAGFSTATAHGSVALRTQRVTLGITGGSTGVQSSSSAVTDSDKAGIGSKGGGGSILDGAGFLPPHSFPLLRRAVTARLVQLWLRHREEWRAAAAAATEAGVAQAGAGEAVRLVREVLLQLFELHRGGMMAREVLEFLHISKAAGTSMCRLAEAAGCRALDFGMGRTCLLREFDDSPRWLNGSHHWAEIATVAKPWTVHPIAFLTYGLPRSPYKFLTCAARVKFMRKMRLNFFANEYTVYNEGLHQNKTKMEPASPEEATRQAVMMFSSYVRSLTAGGREARRPFQYAAAAAAAGSARSGSRSNSSLPYSIVVRGCHLCPEFANVAVLRAPSQRLLSHLSFVAQTYAGNYEWPGIAQAFAPGRKSAAWWHRFAPPLMDAYLLRTLAGEGAFSLPYNRLSQGPYMDLARAMLAQYDVIVVLEAGPDRQRRACNYGLGWNKTLAEFSLRNSTRVRNKTDPNLERLHQLLPTETLYAELNERAVKYDNLLYNYGSVLSALDDLVWVVAHDALGEPLPGFWKREKRMSSSGSGDSNAGSTTSTATGRGGLWAGADMPRCGYINRGMGPN